MQSNQYPRTLAHDDGEPMTYEAAQFSSNVLAIYVDTDSSQPFQLLTAELAQTLQPDTMVMTLTQEGWAWMSERDSQ